MLPGKVLIIDTCGDVGSVALAGRGRVATASLPGRTASERLVATIRELAAQSIALKELQAIAVVNGPGSFTGVRVGVSAAKGLCEALGVPLIAISRLAVLARSAQPNGAGEVQAVLDAGRGEFYAGLYAGEVCVTEALARRDELISGVFAGGTRQLRPVACEPNVADALRELSPELVSQPTAGTALPLALEKLAHDDFADIATLDANYLRRTDAEIFAKQAAHKAAAR